MVDRHASAAFDHIPLKHCDSDVLYFCLLAQVPWWQQRLRAWQRRRVASISWLKSAAKMLRDRLRSYYPFCIRWRYSTWSVYTTCNGIYYYSKRWLLMIVFAFSLAQKSVKMCPWLLYYKLWMKQYHSHQKHSFVSISDCQSPLVTTLPVILLLCGLTAHSTHVHHWSRRVILAISILSFQKELHLFKRWFWHVFWWEREKIA